MKKMINSFIIFFFLLIITSSINFNEKNKKEIRDDASADELLYIYFNGLYFGNQKNIIKVFPDFMHETKKKDFSINYLNNNIEKIKEEYGDNYDFSYKIEDIEKVDEIIFKSIKNYINNFEFAIEPNECYLLNGIISIVGSKKSSDILFYGDIAYCNFNGVWRLITG